MPDTTHMAGMMKVFASPATPPPPAPAAPIGCSFAELAEGYLAHAEVHYMKDGRPTTQVRVVRDALKVLLGLFASTPIAEFGPLKLGLVCDAMIAKGWCRTTVLKHLSAVKAMFKWGTQKEKVSGNVYHALQAFSGPKKGRSKARETKEIVGVADEVVDATLPHLPPVVADMVRVQRLSGTFASILAPPSTISSSAGRTTRPARSPTLPSASPSSRAFLSSLPPAPGSITAGRDRSSKPMTVSPSSASSARGSSSPPASQAMA